MTTDERFKIIFQIRGFPCRRLFKRWWFPVFKLWWFYKEVCFAIYRGKGGEPRLFIDLGKLHFIFGWEYKVKYKEYHTPKI